MLRSPNLIDISRTFNHFEVNHFRKRTDWTCVGFCLFGRHFWMPGSVQRSGKWKRTSDFKMVAVGRKMLLAINDWVIFKYLFWNTCHFLRTLKKCFNFSAFKKSSFAFVNPFSTVVCLTELKRQLIKRTKRMKIFGKGKKKCTNLKTGALELDFIWRGVWAVNKIFWATQFLVRLLFTATVLVSGT